jgi:hypothetical protein
MKPRHTIRGSFLTVLALAMACGAQDEAPSGGPSGENDFPVPSIDWNPERYVAYRTPASLEIDGRLDEAAWEAASWTMDFVDIEGSKRPTPRFRTRGSQSSTASTM